MSDRSIRSVTTAIIFVGLFAAAATPALAQDFRNNFYVHQFWAELEAAPGGPLAFSGPNAQPTGPTGASPGPAAQGGSAAQPSTSAPGGTGPSPSGGAAAHAGSPAAAPPSGGSPSPKTSAHEAAITDILKEAQWVFSGMIYGFSFAYVPADPGRGVTGSFDLTPIAQIKWGDPHLKVLDTRLQGSRLVARVLYSLVPFQERWTEGWDSNVYPSATGRGTSRYFLSFEEKMVSYRDAVKEAIRDYLRQRIYNRPRRVTGQLVLRGSPYTIIDAGQYVTTLTVKLRIDKVEPYSVF